jgi:hypothetical protein
MARTMIEQKEKVVCWMHQVEGINDILKLDNHIVVCPVAFGVFCHTQKRQEMETCPVSVVVCLRCPGSLLLPLDKHIVGLLIKY